MSFLSLLPFELPEGEEIADAFTEGYSLLRAPAGSGKTAVATAYLLTRKERSVLFVRTKAEIDQCLEYLAQMANRTTQTYAPLVGKREACLYPPAEEEKLMFWCRLKNCGKASDRWKNGLMEEIAEREDAGAFASFEDFIAFFRNEGVCPFYAFKRLAKKADLLITTYPYLRDPFLQQRIGDREIAVLDEAHTLLTGAKKEMEKSAVKKASHILEQSPLRPLKTAYRLIRNNKLAKGRLVVEYASFRQFGGTKKTLGEKIVRLKSPANLLSALNVQRKIIMSTTLYPSGLFKNLFFPEKPSKVKMQTVTPLFQTKFRRIYGLSVGLTSQYGERSKRMLKEYADTIQYLSKKTDEITLVFAPSFKFASKLSEYLEVPVSKKKPRENDGLILAVARGSLSEGVNISIERGHGHVKPKLLIMAGLPYPCPNREFKMTVEFLAKEYNFPYDRMFTALNKASMAIALFQACGRVGRSERGVAAVIDGRLEDIALPLQKIHSLSAMQTKIDNFLS